MSFSFNKSKAVYESVLIPQELSIFWITHYVHTHLQYILQFLQLIKFTIFRQGLIHLKNTYTFFINFLYNVYIVKHQHKV